MTYPPQSGAPVQSVPGQYPFPVPPGSPYGPESPYGRFLQPGPVGPRGGAGRQAGCLAVVLSLLLVVCGAAAWRTALRPPSAAPARTPHGAPRDGAGGRPSPSATRSWDSVAAGLTKAFAAKDEEAFVAPFAAGPAKEKERLVFRNLQLIPWETARWEVRTEPYSHQMWVAFVHQVKGVDNLPTAELYQWTVVPLSAGTEVITEVGGRKDSTGRTTDYGYYPAPWDVYGQLAVRVRDHLVALSDQGQAGELDRDVDVLAQAAQDDLAVWGRFGVPGVAGRRGASGFFVVLEKDRATYNRLYNGDGKPDDRLEVGVNLPVPAYEGDRGRTAGEVLNASSRIVLDTTDSRFTRSDWRSGVLNIGRHEMGHAVVAPLAVARPAADGTGYRQSWVVEGFAEYLALRGEDAYARREAQSLRGDPFADRLPPTRPDFYADDADRRYENYVLAGDAVRYLAAEYGDAKVCAFVAAHYARPDQYAQQLTDATGRSPEQFESEWAAHVRATTPIGH